ncbi:MAG: epsilon-lactone hydrolase [Acidobacteriaceae bacterium]|nr:epsilon-lactone hydrolase [Acidobacteriaceae bacterium]
MMRCVAVAILLMGLVAVAQENPAAKITANHAVTEADGTVRMQRVVPLPQGLSPEAKAWLSRPLTTDADVPQTIEQRRAGLDVSQAKHRDELLKMFPVTVKDNTVAGVPVREVVPTTIKHKDRVLICLHGGGFNADSGLTRSRFRWQG